MARLPGIRYDTPVQQLGRDDIYGPIKVANAEAAALQSIGNLGLQVAEVMETNEVAKYSAQFSNQMSELNAHVKNKKSYDKEELDLLDIKYKDTFKVFDPTSPTGYSEVEREEIPAHEVSVEYYKKRADQIRTANTEELSRRGKRVMDKVYASKYAKGITEVKEQELKHAHQYAQAEAETNFELAVNSSDGEGAIMVGETAVANGTWTPAYYASKMGPMPGRVVERGYIIELDTLSDPTDIERVQGEILNNEIMSSAQMSALNKAYESKIQRVNGEIVKELAAEAEEKSSLILSNMSAELILGELDWTSPDDVMAALTQLNDADRKIAINTWKAARNKVKVSSQDKLLEATLMVRGTILQDADGESSFNNRRATARAEITEMVSKGELTVTDYTALLDDLNQIRSIPFKSPEYQMVEDDIYITLTGGKKDMVGDMLGGGEYAIGLADTMYELNNAALEQGPEFDARHWWKVKKPQVLTQTIKTNREVWEKSINSDYEVLDIHGKTDMRATIKNLNTQVTNKKMSRTEADAAIAATGVYVKQSKYLITTLEREEAERRASQ